ncbi:uncharacterized protein SCHCODRAFT_02580100 [Schizophyllum commune H4-8]|uniref:uncharacterized protein n=1 Tax=Schizophyllum commune (strain H4-8 / FGSC 9210) TaxID=578458 RepID=UPI00215E2638|nr:uncharacterized protein SCHCODRAFT_02580100 [Schizophyllum commune H4-8]KAI5890974.1 hypothetical protein SCHCODRAFT_02580100 [Schizophyllum commune H4-8]
MSAAQSPAKMPRTKSPSPPIADATSDASHAAPATTSAAQQFTDETWAVIMSHCSVFDLFCLRDACHLFRTMVDKEMLQNALSDAGLSHLCNITDEARAYLPVALRDLTTFMKMLCVGPCSVCGIWTAQPPASSDLKIRLCGNEDCAKFMYSTEMTRGWNDLPTCITYGTFEPDVEEGPLPKLAMFWQARMLRDLSPYVDGWPLPINDILMGGPNCRFVLKDRRRAEKELAQIGWKSDAEDPDDLVGSSDNFVQAFCCQDEYMWRCARHRTTMIVYNDYVTWRVANLQKSTEVREKNLQTLCARAKFLNKDYDPDHPFTQRILAAHARDGSLMLTPAVDCLFSPPETPKMPYDAEFDHPDQAETPYPLPRCFVPFMDRERPKKSAADWFAMAKPKKNSTPKAKAEAKPVPAPEVPAVAAQSDNVAGPASSPGGSLVPGSSAGTKAAPARSAKSGRKSTKASRRATQATERKNCSLCKDMTFSSQAELIKHQSEAHASTSA